MQKVFWHSEGKTMHINENNGSKTPLTDALIEQLNIEPWLSLSTKCAELEAHARQLERRCAELEREREFAERQAEELRAALNCPAEWTHEQCCNHAKSCDEDRALLDVSEYSIFIESIKMYGLKNYIMQFDRRKMDAADSFTVTGATLRELLAKAEEKVGEDL